MLVGKPGFQLVANKFATFAIFQFLAPKNYSGGLAPFGYGVGNSISPLSFGKSFIKIRSAVPEIGCLIVMHFVVADEKKQKKTKKNICKTYAFARHLAARMRKQRIR